MTLSETQVELTNWSKSARSTCFVYKVSDAAGIARALAAARAQGLSVIPHGAGHSYTDAALNTGGVVIDVTPMRQILSWDAAQGIMRVEPGVTLREMVQVAWKDGWWPAVSPSTPEVTIGGCAAMNVNGRNAWKCGPLAHISSRWMCCSPMEKYARLRRSGMRSSFMPSLEAWGYWASSLRSPSNSSACLPGTSPSAGVPAACTGRNLRPVREEEHSSDFMEAWLDGFARGRQLGRGHVN